MEYVIQSSMFYSFYLFLFILLCNVDSALVSGSNAYIWILNCVRMFELYSIMSVNLNIFYKLSNVPTKPVVLPSNNLTWR